MQFSIIAQGLGLDLDKEEFDDIEVCQEATLQL
jgi:hypothetical protein